MAKRMRPPGSVSNPAPDCGVKAAVRRQFEQLVLAAVGDARLYKTVS